MQNSSLDIRPGRLPLCLASLALATGMLACGDVIDPEQQEGEEEPATGLTIDSVSPSSGPITGGTAVTLIGTGFLGEDTRVLIGGVASVDVEVLSDQALVFRTPAVTEPGDVGITVFNAGGFGAVGNGYTYNPLISLDAVKPAIGHADGGNSVELMGSGFQDGDPGPLLVTFQGEEIDFTVNSDASLSIEVPPGEAWTAADISVSSRNGSSELPRAYTYALPGLLGSDRTQGTLFHIQPATGEASVIRSSSTGARVTAMVMSPTGRIFAAHPGHAGNFNNHIAEIFLDGEEEEVIVGEVFAQRAGGLTLSPNGTLLVASRNFQAIAEVDVDTDSIITLMPMPEGNETSCRGCAIATDSEGRVFAAFNGTAGTLHRFVDNAFEPGVTLIDGTGANDNIKSMTFAGPILVGIRRGTGGLGVAPGGGGGNESLIRIDPGTGEITNLGPLPTQLDALTVIPIGQSGAQSN